MQNELERFRNSESVEASFVIINDLVAKKVVAAWPFVPIRQVRDVPDLDGLEEAERWDALWNCIEFDPNDLAARAGISRIVLNQKFEMVRSSRLIFPDGEISALARKHLRAEVVEKLTSRTIPKKKGAKNK